MSAAQSQARSVRHGFVVDKPFHLIKKIHYIYTDYPEVIEKKKHHWNVAKGAHNIKLTERNHKKAVDANVPTESAAILQAYRSPKSFCCNLCHNYLLALWLSIGNVLLITYVHGPFFHRSKKQECRNMYVIILSALPIWQKIIKKAYLLLYT